MCIINLDTLKAAAALVDEDLWVYDLRDGTFWHNKGLTLDDWKAKLTVDGDWEFVEKSPESWRHVDMTSAFPMDLCVNGRWVRLCCTPVLDEDRRVVGVIGVEKDVTIRKSLLPKLMELKASNASHTGGVYGTAHA